MWAQTVDLLEENRSICELRSGSGFSDMTPKARANKKQEGGISLKHFVPRKNTRGSADAKISALIYFMPNLLFTVT